MAEKPLGNNILPADLPTDWVNSQTITADGEEIGLDPQYGYNYLNTQINNAQGSINSINDAFGELVTVDDLESHEEDENVHVSSADRTKWNAAKDQTYIDGQDSTTLASAKDYTDSQISSITGADESVISHVNNTLIHVTQGDRDRWDNATHVSCYSNYPTTTSVASYEAFNYISSTTSSGSVLIPGSAISIPNPFGTADREIRVIANVQCYTREDNATVNFEDCNTSVYMFNRLNIGDGKNGAISSCGTYAVCMHGDGYGTGTAHLAMSGTSTGDFPVCLYYQRGRGQDGNDQSAIMGFSMIVIQTKL